LGARHNGGGITKMHGNIVNLYNVTGGNATEYDGTEIRHDDNITGGKATDNGAETGSKATDTGTGGKTTDNLSGGKATNNLAGDNVTDKLAGGKATDNVTRYDGILQNLSEILMRLINKI